MAQSAASQPQVPSSPLQSLIFPALMVLGVFYLLVFRPQSSERKKAQQMLASLKKGDRVVTIGGIVGTIVAVADREVTIKVDESNNTKMTFTRWGIKEVLGAEPPAK
jgi:preprotein translocase subunit YajC